MIPKYLLIVMMYWGGPESEPDVIITETQSLEDCRSKRRTALKENLDSIEMTAVCVKQEQEIKVKP